MIMSKSGRFNRELLLMLILGFSMLFMGCAHKPAVSLGRAIQSMEDERGYEATGYAVIAIQNHEDPAQQRLMAIRASKMDAYRSLVEQVYGQHIDSTTTIGDLAMSSDIFRARLQGVIYGAKLVSIKTVGDDTYAVTLSLSSRVVNDLRKLYLNYMNDYASQDMS